MAHQYLGRLLFVLLFCWNKNVFLNGKKRYLCSLFGGLPLLRGNPLNSIALKKSTPPRRRDHQAPGEKEYLKGWKHPAVTLSTFLFSFDVRILLETIYQNNMTHACTPLLHTFLPFYFIQSFCIRTSCLELCCRIVQPNALFGKKMVQAVASTQLFFNTQSSNPCSAAKQLC